MKFGLDEKIIIMIVEVLKKYNIEEARIFGSRSDGTYKKTSDIDIAVFDENIDKRQFALLADEIENLDIIYKVDIINFYTLQDERLKSGIQRNGKTLYKKN